MHAVSAPELIPRRARDAALAIALALVALAAGSGCGGDGRDTGEPRFEVLQSPELEYTEAHGISGDGRLVVGEGGPLPWRGFPWRFALRWTREEGVVLLGIPGRASFASRDGSVIVGDQHVPPVSRGFLSPTRPFRALDGSAPALLPDGRLLNATAMTPDGSVVGGQTDVTLTGFMAYRWTEAGTVLLLPPLGTDRFPEVPRAFRADGSVVFSYAYGAVAPGDSTALRRDASGVTALPAVDGLAECEVVDASDDGEVVVGTCSRVVGTPGAHRSVYAAVRWVAERGEVLGVHADANVLAHAASADGSVVVGTWRPHGEQMISRAVVWTEVTGMRFLDEVLRDEGVDLGPWSLEEARGVSDDGRVVAGGARVPGGAVTAFRSVLR